MTIDAISLQGTGPFQLNKGADQLSEGRKQKEDPTRSETTEKKQLQPEELLQQIKALTEDGFYSVRFENDNATGKLVVKLVDRESNEVLRQIPTEELLTLSRRLSDLRGNLVDTQS